MPPSMFPNTTGTEQVVGRCWPWSKKKTPTRPWQEITDEGHRKVVRATAVQMMTQPAR